VENVCLKIDGTPVISNFNFSLNRGDKIVLIGPNTAAKTILLQMLAKEVEPDGGTITWGVTVTPAYFPKENSAYFTGEMTVLEWLSQYTKITDNQTIRGFLGRMLFSGDESLKKIKVLSGGEKVRCMLSRMMIMGANALLLDEPTNHLDLEAITALNNGLIEFPEVVIFTSHDHQFVSTIANRIVEIMPGGIIDRVMSFDEYMSDSDVGALRDSLYHGHHRMDL
jgi:ATPase subunit of ABC transporter with duplicated ATPase domains